MKVKCITNHIKEINEERREAIVDSGYGLSDGDYSLEVGRVYTVYGLIFEDKSFQYLICDSEDDNYPVPKHPDFFEVVNNQISKYWQLNVNLVTEKNFTPALVFLEWATDSMFFEDLIDGDREKEILFAKYKKLMDEEF